MKYYVEYNCQYMAIYKSVKACLNLINRKGWKNDENNMLRIVDENGDEYDTIKGIKFEDEDCIDSPLTEREFDNLVGLMEDCKMDFELKPATTPNGYVVLKFKDGSFFRCLAKDFDRAVDYINGLTF